MATKTNEKTNKKRGIAAEVSQQIIEALERGVRPWEPRFDHDKAGGPMAPMNAITGKPYRGINVLILGMSPLAFMSGDPRWATYKQAQESGWQVKKGSRSTGIVFYNPPEPADADDGEAEDRPGGRIMRVLKSFNVFHASQIDGIPAFRPPTIEEAPWRRPEAAETILKGSKAQVRVGGSQAFYSPSTDHIQMPPDSAFRSPEAWAGTALHELAHWADAPTRLNRDLSGRYGSAAYALGELRAEISSAFTCATIGISTEFGNSAAYIASWLKALKNDKRELFRAAADAQKTTDFLLNFHPAYAASLKHDPHPGGLKEALTRSSPTTGATPSI